MTFLLNAYRLTAPGGPPPASSYSKATIEGLRDQTTWNGRNSANPFKVPGVDPMETGMAWNAGAKKVTLSGLIGIIEDWDFSDVWVEASGGCDILAITQCRFRETVGTNGFNYLLNMLAGSRLRFLSYADFSGPGMYGGAGALINATYSGTSTVGSIDYAYRVRMVQPAGDHLKACGSADPGGSQWELCYLGPPVNLDAVPTPWNAGTTYGIGDHVRSGGGYGWGDVHKSKVAGNIGNAPPADAGDANWQWLDPHADGITTVAALNTITLNGCLYDHTNQVPGGSLDDRATGQNNAIRASRNSGTNPQFDGLCVLNCVGYQVPRDGLPIQVSDNGLGNWVDGNVHFIDSWFQPNGNGFVWHTSSNGRTTTWNNVLNSVSLAAITGPTGSSSTDPRALPVNTAAPTISGTVQANALLTWGVGTWTMGVPRPRFALSLQQSADGAAGWTTTATVYHGRSYTVPVGLVGKYIRLKVEAIHILGTVTAYSAVALVAAAPTGPMIEGVQETIAGASSTSFSWALPAGWQAGETCYAAITMRQGDAIITPPAGWTQVHSQSGYSVGAGRLVVYNRVMQAGDTNPSIVFDLARTRSGIVWRISSSTGAGASPAGAATFTASRNSVSITSAANSLILHIWGWQGATACTGLPAAGGVTQHGPYQPAGSSYAIAAVSEVVAAGATVARTATFSASIGICTCTIEVLD
jgi:hypothetical protein